MSVVFFFAAHGKLFQFFFTNNDATILIEIGIEILHLVHTNRIRNLEGVWVCADIAGVGCEEIGRNGPSEIFRLCQIFDLATPLTDLLFAKFFSLQIRFIVCCVCALYGGRVS